ncbi:TPA_asm: hypothetical protein [Hydra adintovirus]|nr:TPA_asm: hypothetical protein [Hydra adintovirus]
MSEKVKYTKKYLANLLKENNIKETSNKKIALVMLAIDNGLIEKESFLSDVHVKKPRGRKRIHQIKEKKERDPKYYWLTKVRTNPITVKLTNLETGEVKVYKSFYEYVKKEKHSKSYLDNNNGKVKNNVKIEMIKSSEACTPSEIEK